MNKILLIGKFNNIYQELNNAVSKYFNVQLCTDAPDMVAGLMKLNTPDLIIISLNGLEANAREIFNELKYNYMNIPVFCVGTQVEQKMCGEYINTPNVYALTRPIGNNHIVKAAFDILNETLEEELPEDEETPKLNILIVDDNPTHLRSMDEIFSKDYDVTVAVSGMKALTCIGKRVPDLIILDYDMPLCDGRLTLEMIRELDEAKNIPVIFLTGIKDREHIEAVLSMKPSGYLLKPIAADKLLEIVKNTIG